MGISEHIELKQVDGNSLFPCAGKFNAIVSYDVVLHLQNRERTLAHLVSQLDSRGKLLITDAGVVSGAITNEEIRLRSVNGFTQFVPEGFNERILESLGLRLISIVDRTDGVLKNATGRLKARQNYAGDLIELEGVEKFTETQSYLETVIDLSSRKSLSRIAYLAEVQ